MGCFSSRTWQNLRQIADFVKSKRPRFEDLLKGSAAPFFVDPAFGAASKFDSAALRSGWHVWRSDKTHRRSSNRERFDFTKSAICRRFCKVRLRKHFPEMFSSLRMTRDGFVLQYYSVSPHPPQAVPLLPRRRLFVSLFFAQENNICCLILFSITDNPHPLRRAMPLTEPSPAEKVASD